MTPPNIDMEKLKAVCPEMVWWWELGPDNSDVKFFERLRAVTATMLRLAEENERLKKRLKKAVRSGFDMGEFSGRCKASRKHKKDTGRSEPC